MKHYTGHIRYPWIENYYTAVIVGAGNIGRAIVNYPNFRRRGLNLIGIFDNDPNVIGSQVGNLKVINVNQLTDF